MGWAAQDREGRTEDIMATKTEGLVWTDREKKNKCNEHLQNKHII